MPLRLISNHEINLWAFLQPSNFCRSSKDGDGKLLVSSRKAVYPKTKGERIRKEEFDWKIRKDLDGVERAACHSRVSIVSWMRNSKGETVKQLCTIFLILPQVGYYFESRIKHLNVDCRKWTWRRDLEVILEIRDPQVLLTELLRCFRSSSEPIIVQLLDFWAF